MKKEVIVMNKNDQEFLVQKIRTQYTEKEHTALDELKELDTKVKRPANVFASIFGSISALIMGAGMSLVMTDIGGTLCKFYGLRHCNRCCGYADGNYQLSDLQRHSQLAPQKIR